MNNYLLHYNASSNNFFLLLSVKLIEYIFSALSVSSYHCVRSLPRIKMSFFLLSIFIDELIFTLKIITFLTVPPLGCEKNPCVSKTIPHPKYLYLSISAFLVTLTAPNKQFSNVA